MVLRPDFVYDAFLYGALCTLETIGIVQMPALVFAVIVYRYFINRIKVSRQCILAHVCFLFKTRITMFSPLLPAKHNCSAPQELKSYCQTAGPSDGVRPPDGPYGNTAQYACGIFRKNRALISSLFLAIHKVFLRKSAIIRTRFFSESALAALCGIALYSFL